MAQRDDTPNTLFVTLITMSCSSLARTIDTINYVHGIGNRIHVRPHFFCAREGGNKRLHLLVLELWLVYLSWLLLNTQRTIIIKNDIQVI